MWSKFEFCSFKNAKVGQWVKVNVIKGENLIYIRHCTSGANLKAVVQKCKSRSLGQCERHQKFDSKNEIVQVVEI